MIDLLRKRLEKYLATNAVQEEQALKEILQGVHTLVPGLTGWAQVNGRDELPIPEKVKLDVAYLQRQSLWFDVRILWLTFVKVLRRDGVSH